jgi:hypothetical protein
VQSQERTTVSTVNTNKTTTVPTVTAVVSQIDKYPQYKPKTYVKPCNDEIDYLIETCKDLTQSSGRDMSGWYAKSIRQIGSERFRELASLARADGKNPPKYFSWLIKRELQ